MAKHGEIDVRVHDHDFDGKSHKIDQVDSGRIFEFQRNWFAIKTQKCWNRMDDSYLPSQYELGIRTFFSETLSSLEHRPMCFFEFAIKITHAGLNIGFSSRLYRNMLKIGVYHRWHVL